MSLAKKILDIVGAGIAPSIRIQFTQLTCLLFSYLPIETVQSLFGLFGRGETFEEQAICDEAFEAAKLGGSGSLSDQNARTMALRYADKFATNAPIEAVIVCLDMLERIHSQKMLVNSDNANALLEESLDKIETSDDGVFVYLRNKLNN
jgi:hypothetical protein